MSNELELGLRFTGNERDLADAAAKGEAAVKGLGEAAKKSNEEAARAAQQYTDSLRRQADTLGMSRSQVLAYEGAQHKLTDAQRQGVQQSIIAIDAYDRKQAMLGRVQVMAAAAGTALGVAFVAGAKASVAAAVEAERSQIRLEAVLRATSGASGMTISDLDRMAGEMQDKLGISDEAIKDSMAVLLTFRKVGRESFGEAMAVAANLSAAFGGDLKSATMQLGKALEDPEQGLAALTRAGVTFNSQQKEVIKDLVETGRHGEAITLILRRMKEQGLDGVAEAMNTGLPGAVNKTRIAWDELLERLGKTSAVGGNVQRVLDNTTAQLNTLRGVVEADSWIDKLDILMATPGYVTKRMRDRQAAEAAKPKIEAWDSDDRDAGRAYRGAEEARERASEYLKQFRSDNQKLEDELKKWNRLADSAGYTTEKRAEGEASIRAKLAKKGSSDANAGKQLIMGLTEQLAQASGEATVFDKVMRQVTAGTQKFTEAEIAAALALAGEIDMRAAARKEIDAAVALYDQEEAKRKTSAATIAELNESLSMQAQGLQMEIDLMGASDTQREKAIALRELENKFIKARIGLDGEALAQSYEMERVERERLASLLDQRGAARERSKALEDQKAEQKRFNDDLARGLTDSIFRGFEGGKSFARNFWDSMKNMAKTTILQPVVKFLLSPVTGAIGGALGGLGIPGMGNAATGAAGGAGGMGGLGSLFGGGNPMGWIMNSAGSGGGIMGGIDALSMGANAIFQNAGVAMGSQWIADIGNFGFGVPAMGAITNLMMGNAKGAVGSAALGTLGTMFGGPIGGMIGSAVGSMLGGSKKTSAYLVGRDIPSGSVSYSTGLSADVYGNSQKGDRWHGETWSNVFTNEIRAVYDTIERTANTLGLDGSRVRGMSTTVSTGSFMESGEILTAVINQVSDQLAQQVMPNLTRFAQAGESATQTLMRMITVQEQLTELERQQGVALGNAARNLPGQLGITGLLGARDALSVSEYQAPLSRLGAARSLLDDTFAKGMAGDLGAVSSFPQMLQQALSIGRDVGASGPAFQALFTEGNRQLNELLTKQQSIQTEIIETIPLAIIESSKDQIAEIKRQTQALLKAMEETNSQLRAIREGA